jgi:hypothetical protein
VGKGRFLNQKLGKRASRRMNLLKSKITTRGTGRASGAADTRLPKKGASRQQQRTPGA